MKHSFRLVFAALPLALLSCSQPNSSQTGSYPVEPVLFTSVQINDDFFSHRLKASREVTVPLAFSKCEQTGRYDNFVRAAHPDTTYVVEGFSFDDTDVYKTIEGASYLLSSFPDEALESYIDSILTIVAAAQMEDGYLNTARQMNPVHPHKWMGSQRWEKVEELSHEFYNLGHMVEGAVAHYQATGKRNFLDIAIRYADCVCREIGALEGQTVRVPGHQIAEMALCRLYNVTGDEKYLAQAKFFLDRRGTTSVRTEYSQSHIPPVDQSEAVGHAVRAEYMYSGMADVAALTSQTAYVDAIDRIWDNMVGCKTYITGGVGSRYAGEAFGDNYELPNLTSYCETCASIGNVFTNHRMFLLHADSKYYDVLERTLYNALLAGVSLDGGAFFYPNPLASDGSFLRQSWFGCACCPSNICRFIPSIPGYIYARKGSELFVNLYVDSTMESSLNGKMVALSQHTAYPWEQEIRITIDENRAGKFSLKLRIPCWARGEVMPGGLYSFVDEDFAPVEIFLGSQKLDFREEKGYAVIERKWKKGDTVVVKFDSKPHFVRAREEVKDDRGKVCVVKGPIVYCAEEVDNPSVKVRQAGLDVKAPLSFEHSDMLCGIDVIKSGDVTLIPYYAWNHRGKGEMTVWFDEK